MKVRIRFNTEYPKGKKWRLVFEDNHEIQVDEFRGECEFCSDTSEMPIVGIKHHLMAECDEVELTMSKDHQLNATFI